ncbi:hypothetical protein [Planococcus lenghuensis]|uniref:Helix-turn-helix domain-containing protein n=1 Tax=Planococcus lenghuensis TaxID=2213202 RepID=A0A1Q2L564_9BACL|nr:hypothetical protein [Planococcus lenghuensis]AQQ55569.1 hypothetical protein B0X71_20565 [Planococcus lenghuensis]
MKKDVKKRFGLSSSIPATTEEDRMLKEYHQNWRQTNSSLPAPFLPLFVSFREKHLKTIDGGPLKLYLYFAYAADNSYGHSWHGVEKIADFFGVQTRTVDKWIKVLVDNNLIYREQHGKKSSTTYLIPYSDTLIRQRLQKTAEEPDNQKSLDILIDKIKKSESLYGPIAEVLHLFQWNTQKSEPVVSDNIQWFFIVTRREDDVLTCHYLPLKNANHHGLNEAEIEDVANFISPYHHANYSVRGIALTHSIKLTDSNPGPYLGLARSILLDETWNWADYPSVQYGPVSSFFKEEKKKVDQKE